jgi:hypothetical protein
MEYSAETPELEKLEDDEDYEFEGRARYKETAKSLFILANIIAGALVFGQLLNDEFNRLAFLIGVIGSIILYYSAIKLLQIYDRS